MDEGLRRQLLRMADDDQSARRAHSSDTGSVDRRNTAHLKQIVAANGWPGRRLVGDDGAQAAWCIVQHSADLTFMTRCLGLLHGAAEALDAPPANLAYLEDRVRMFRGESQVYGTQFIEKDGTYEPWPIEDVEGVDERRAQMCLGPLTDYAAHIRALIPPLEPEPSPTRRT